MLVTRISIAQQLAIQCRKQTSRSITALFITGDKAKENYVALQPYLDFESTFSQRELLQSSITHRKLNLDLSEILSKYARFKELSNAIRTLEAERTQVAHQIKELEKKADSGALKERGKALRNQLKATKEQFYPIEDEFIHTFLNLPNALHDKSPSNGHEQLLYRSSKQLRPKCDSHLNRTDLVRFVDNSRYYMLREAAEFDINCMHALTNYLVDKGNFQHMANPDFTRCVLLEANATPLEHYHLVVEENLQNKLNTAYLTGGASFESFLGAMTKLCVYPAVLPLRLVSSGRNYNKTDCTQSASTAANLFTATQTNAVQTFVASTSANEANQHMDDILNLVVDFYKAFDVPFRIVYANAHNLTLAESLRAVIEVHSPAQQRYIPVGHVSNYGDFVSKRILFSTRLQQQRDYHFLHLVGGPILNTTRLIAALIENGVSLDCSKLLGARVDNAVPIMPNAVDEFKSLFK